MQFKHATLDFDGQVAVLKLDHQEVMNAVSMDMLGGLSEALDAIEEKRDEVRCLVVTGGLEVDADLITLAERNGVSLLLSPHDSATTATLCRYSSGISSSS